MSIFTLLLTRKKVTIRYPGKSIDQPASVVVVDLIHDVSRAYHHHPITGEMKISADDRE